MPSHNDVEAFHKVLTSSRRIVAFCGAGLAASSGLPTFHSPGSYWRNHDATKLATKRAFMTDPGLVWLFYGYMRHSCLRARPSAAHRALAALAKVNPDFLCLTQNVDNLSQRADHPLAQLYTLHGSLFDIKCTTEDCDWVERGNLDDPFCPALAAASEDPPEGKSLPLLDPYHRIKHVSEEELPRCPKCKTGLQRPGVPWFGEELDGGMLDRINNWMNVEKIPATQQPLMSLRRTETDIGFTSRHDAATRLATDTAGYFQEPPPQELAPPGACGVRPLLDKDSAFVAETHQPPRRMLNMEPSISGSGGSGAWHMSLAARATDPSQEAMSKAGLGIVSFLTAISVSIAIFAAQFTLKPKTYLVPERERTDSPPRSLVGMIRTLISYHDRDVINKCGLDAYFFLRYLRTLLVIFIPICVLVLPVLVPINYVGGKGKRVEGDKTGDSLPEVPTGLDTLAWGNIIPSNARRYTAHLVMAILVVIWVCTVFFFELRVYIKIRQDYLTSAEHRLRASATTVLVNSIPRKWLTEEALTGLFDVFPGGVRNVWLNRDLTTLLDKISLRDSIHKQLEAAETDLIRAAKKAQMKKRNAEEKKCRRKLNLDALTKKEMAARKAVQDAEAERLARADIGTDAGKEQDVPHTVDAAIRESQQDSLVRADSREQSRDGVKPSERRLNPRRHVAVGLKGVAGVAGKAGRGVEHAIGTSHGFMHMSPNPVPSNRDSSSYLPVTSFDVPCTTTPEGSVLTSSSTKILSNSDKKEGRPAENTVRKLDNIDDMFVNDKPKFWQFWKPPPGAYASPVPQGANESDGSDEESVWQSWKKTIPFLGPKEEAIKYDDAFDTEYNIDMDTDAEWAKYLKKRDRPTHRLPLFGVTWLFGLPFVTKKVDTIYWCRQELARLNLEIAEDQKHPSRFPLMSSAFIQFNHQVAAHMACQSVVHHLPKQMTPRLIEISPRDVEWGNMAVNWWQQLLRTFIVVTVVIAMIILWGIPVGWTAAIGQADALLRKDGTLRALANNEKLGTIVKAVSGVLPAALLALLLFLVPVIFGVFAGFKGSKTGSEKTEFVQKYYFTFLFVQVFLVVSIASFVFKSLDQFINDVSKLSNVSYVLDLLARNLPSAAIYFFSYMILQALTSSSATLLQVGTLFSWFILGPIFDSTARDKWARNMSLNQVSWGSVFPVYTNFACIGIVYCVVAPLISIFSVITFSLLWLSQRYAMVYVNRFEQDTRGVLYPRAINQTFTGLYFMELCLAGLFFIVIDGNGQNICFPHGVTMLVLCVLTIGYQVMLNKSFSPLFRYLPITFEDEAVLRDEAFQRAQDVRFGLIRDQDQDQDQGQKQGRADHAAENAENAGNGPRDDKERSARSSSDDEVIEVQKVENSVRRSLQLDGLYKPVKQVSGWAKAGGHQIRKLTHLNEGSSAAQYRRRQRQKDLESQRAIGAALYGGMHDDIEDLTPDERDALTQHAFLHVALRARRPTVWIPRDDLGISDDEIRRTHAFSKHIWISNEGTALDSKARVVYGKNPPDFSEIDIINL
ncbi:hypothetical protein E4U53_007600 [Claviceps sorghi]|nr:hypothetical protein E4U53_007600 [Claviceps sorghi]